MNKSVKSTDLCRVCSGRGEFDLFLPIPIFLHENLLEHMKWTKNISELISEITGLSINKDDGLPQKICEICISYLKHAYTFREQTLNNTISLMTALDIQQECTTSPEKQKYDNTNILGQQSNKNCNNATVLNNLLVKTTKSDNENNSESNLQNNNEKKFFKNNINLYNNLKSTVNTKFNFDMYLSNKGAVVQTFTPPPAPLEALPPIMNVEVGDADNASELVHKERKCKYCKKRYMFKDTYDQHINECVERKLVIFIWELNYIQTSKENNQITSKQFIQKTLMILKENVILLVKYSNDFDFPDVIPKNVDATREINRRLDNIIKYIDNNDKMCSDETPSGSSTTSTPSTYKIRCSNCDVTFESLSCLEIHNFKYHNDSSEVPPVVPTTITNLPKSINDFYHGETTIINFNSITNENLIELIESEDNLIDVSSTFSGYLINNINNSSSSNNKQKTDNLTDKIYKTIPCGKCGKRFSTVGHLDQHMLNKHHNQNNSYANLKLVPLPIPPSPTLPSKYYNMRPDNF